MQILTTNAVFIWSMPVPDHYSAQPYTDGGGAGFPWQQPGYYAAYLQYLIETNSMTPQQYANLNATYDFFTDSSCSNVNTNSENAVGNNWANLRARRGHPAPYSLLAVILGIEAYGDAQENMGANGAEYGAIAEAFRVAIRARGGALSAIPLGLQADQNPMSDFGRTWFEPMLTNVATTNISYLDLYHHYQFGSPADELNRILPGIVDVDATIITNQDLTTRTNSPGWQEWWLPQSQWPASGGYSTDFSRFLWMYDDVRVALSEYGENATRWKIGCAEHGLSLSSKFIGNDMGAALHWALWLSELMRYNADWDMNWVLAEQGDSHAQLQYVMNTNNGVWYLTRTPGFYVYKMAQEFYGYEYHSNSYMSPTAAAGIDPIDGGGRLGGTNATAYSSPDVVVRVFRNPTDNHYHLFVINKNATNAVTFMDWTNWSVVKWEQLHSANYTDGNPLGMPGPEPITNTIIAPPPFGSPLVITNISVNHIELSGDTVWVEDAVPAGAWTSASGGDSNSWIWVSNNPAPFSGSLAHQSTLQGGEHDHVFADATDTLMVNTGDTLITYVYLDPNNSPQEIMLQWFDGSSWNHRAYWGADLLAWGTDGTASQTNIANVLPPTGTWVRLEVPASKVGLEGSTLTGMGFILSDGQATWDHSGKSGP